MVDRASQNKQTDSVSDNVNVESTIKAGATVTSPLIVKTQLMPEDRDVTLLLK